MTKARPDKGQTEGFTFRSARARRLNTNGVVALIVAVVLGAFTASVMFGATGAGPGTVAGPVRVALLTLTGLLSTVALVALIVARRFERTDRAATRASLRRTLASAYRDMAPRVPVGLVQPVGSAVNGDGT